MTRSLVNAIRNIFSNSPPVRQARAAFHIARSLYRKNFARKETEIPDDVKTYARITATAYNNHNDRPEVIDGYEYFEPLSTDRIAVYKNDFEVVMASRGTVLSYTDVRNDLRILVGESFGPDNERVRELVQYGQIIQDTFPNHSLVVVGHSLGATLANTVSDMLNARGYLFNIGSSPYQSRTPCRLCKYWVIDSDPISLSALSIVRNKQIYILEKQKPNLSSHTIHQFT